MKKSIKITLITAAVLVVAAGATFGTIEYQHSVKVANQKKVSEKEEKQYNAALSSVDAVRKKYEQQAQGIQNNVDEQYKADTSLQNVETAYQKISTEGNLNDGINELNSNMIPNYSQAVKNVQDLYTKYRAELEQVHAKLGETLTANDAGKLAKYITEQMGYKFKSGAQNQQDVLAALNSQVTKFQEEVKQWQSASTMNVQQIAQQNFSSIAGTWKNGNGDIILITLNTIQMWDKQLSNNSIMKFLGYICTSQNGIAYVTDDAGAGSPALLMDPANVDAGINVTSDRSKDRIFNSQNFQNAGALAAAEQEKYVYYKENWIIQAPTKDEPFNGIWYSKESDGTPRYYDEKYIISGNELRYYMVNGSDEGAEYKSSEVGTNIPEWANAETSTGVPGYINQSLGTGGGGAGGLEGNYKMLNKDTFIVQHSEKDKDIFYRDGSIGADKIKSEYLKNGDILYKKSREK